MLSDQDEEKRQNPLNPLRKAMRRRNVKKVEFSASNSFLEPDENVYSSSEEEEGDSELIGQEPGDAEEHKQEQERDIDQDAKVAPLNTRDRVNGQRPDEPRAEIDNRHGVDQPNGVEPSRDSDEILERNG